MKQRLWAHSELRADELQGLTEDPDQIRLCLGQSMAAGSKLLKPPFWAQAACEVRIACTPGARSPASGRSHTGWQALGRGRAGVECRGRRGPCRHRPRPGRGRPPVSGKSEAEAGSRSRFPIPDLEIGAGRTDGAPRPRPFQAASAQPRAS